MDRNAFLAIALCFGIYLTWYNFTAKPVPLNPNAPTTIAQSTAAPSNTAQMNSAAVTKAEPAKLIEMGGDNFRVTVNTQGGVLVRTNINYSKTASQTEQINSLIGGSSQLELTASPATTYPELPNLVYSVVSQGKNKNGNEELVLGFENDKLKVTRRYTMFSDQYWVDHDSGITFKGEKPNYVFLSIRSTKADSKIENERRHIYFNKVSGGNTEWTPSDISEDKEEISPGHWTGISSRYFLNALLNLDPVNPPQFQARPAGEEVMVSLVYKATSPIVALTTRYYYGPKKTETLKAAGTTLGQAVDFGWFTIFAYPMLKALKWFNNYVNNFGVAIILLTVLVKILTYPLTLKSMKGMKEMQRIQPQIAAIRERHKDDKEALNREMMAVMKTHGFNPMAGCLPILVQMPIFIALYNVLYGAIDLYGQPFFGWIHDLSSKDPYYVTPVLLGIGMFLQQKITPQSATMDPAQQKMMTFMPVIFAVMMLWLPAGLTLYMLVNTIVSMLQTKWIYKKLGMHPA